jgi:hypothetical protein
LRLNKSSISFGCDIFLVGERGDSYTRLGCSSTPQTFLSSAQARQIKEEVGEREAEIWAAFRARSLRVESLGNKVLSLLAGGGGRFV